MEHKVSMAVHGDMLMLKAADQTLGGVKSMRKRGSCLAVRTAPVPCPTTAILTCMHSLAGSDLQQASVHACSSLVRSHDDPIMRHQHFVENVRKQDVAQQGCQGVLRDLR